MDTSKAADEYIDCGRYFNHLDRLSTLERGVPKNVPAPFCMPLHCTAFDCDGEGARTP